MIEAAGISSTVVKYDAGEPPTDAQLADLTQRVENSDAKVLLWEAAPSAEASARAAEMGLTSVVFPPLANTPAEGDFVSGMMGVLEGLRDWNL